MAVGRGFEIPVLLILTPDVDHDSSSGFILNRLGQMHRGVYTDDLCGYGYHLADCGRSFTRTNMTISQIRTSNCGPGKLALFKLEDWKTVSLVGNIDTIRIGQPIESLSTSTEPFECSGGVMPLRHECRDCQKLGGFKLPLVLSRIPAHGVAFPIGLKIPIACPTITKLKNLIRGFTNGIMHFYNARSAQMFMFSLRRMTSLTLSG